MWLLIGVLLILTIIIVLIQIPAIQTKLTHYAISFISDKTHTRVELKKISIRFPKSLIIKGLYLEDIKNDTLLFAGEAKINIQFKDLFKKKIHIRAFSLDDVNLRIIRTPADSLFNYNFLIQAFSDTSAQTKIKPNTSSKWTFSIDKVVMNAIRVQYADDYGGMTAYAAFRNLKIKMDHIDFKQSNYSIDELLLEELKANVLVTKASVPKASPTGAPTGGSLLKILANNMEIRNSTVIYTDSTSQLSISAGINLLKISDAAIDLKSDLEIKIKQMDMEKNSFAYHVLNKPELENSFDPGHMEFERITLAARDIYYSAAKTEASIMKFMAVDRNDFSITQFETDFSMDRHSITAKNLKAKTVNSSIDADLNIRYASLKTLADSLQSVILNADLRSVSIMNSDITYFDPQLRKQPFFKNGMNMTVISGSINGSMDNLNGKDLIIKAGVNTVLKTDLMIEGLPDFENANFYFPNLEIQTGKKDIEMIAGPSIPKSIELPEKINLQIRFKGQIKDFESSVDLGSSFGTAHIFARIDRFENFNSNLELANFDLGRLLKDTSMYGPVTITAEMKGKGLDKKSISAEIKAEAPHFFLNTYNYHNLNIDGTINGQKFEGKINLNDENAVFDFAGLVNLNPNEEQYVFRLNVPGVDLKKLNFTKKNIQIGFKAVADLKGGKVQGINGEAGISNIIIAHEGKKYLLDSLLVASINEPNKSDFKLSSALVGIRYSGTVSPTDLYTVLNQFINKYFPFSNTPSLKRNSKLSAFNFEIQLHNHPILSQVILPQLKVFVPGLIQGSFDEAKSELKLNVTVKNIVYGTTEIKDFVLDVNSDAKEFKYKISSLAVSTAQIKLDNFLLEGKLSDNVITANLSSIDGKQNKKLLINSQIKKHEGNYRLMLDPEEFFLMNSRWDIAADNYIEFGKQGFIIHHLFMNNAESQINIASIHDRFNEDLSMAVKNFKLDNISRIIEKDTSLVKGNVDGNILLKRVNNTYGIIADAKISNLIVRDIPIGNLTLKTENPTGAKFDLEAGLSDAGNNLTVKGHFIPNGGDNSIQIQADIQSLSMRTIEAFSMGQLTETSGTVSGNFLIRGRTSAPEVTGELAFNNAFIKPSALNTRLELKNEKIQFKKDGIYLNSFTILDKDGHTAIIDGKVLMQQFKNLIFDLRVNAQDFLLSNTTSEDNKEFFGRMIIDSKMDIKGPISLPVINGRLKIKKGSNFTFAVPEDKLSTDKGEDVVEFTDSSIVNPILLRSINKEAQKSKFKGIEIASIIEMDKQATLKLLLDPASTDSLVVKGEAALSFTIDRSGKMSLAGAYNLNEGSYLVTLQSVIKKKFDIIPGSTIIWNGEPLDAEISINASYSVRASPYDLLFDQISGLSEADKGGYKNRYPFLVLLKLRGAILHPQISFEIQLAPEDKGILGGVVLQKLNLLNEDESALNKQVFALLVLGRFIQENPLQTESGGTSTLVRSTVGKFLSAQLNQLSSKVIPGVELNFDIQSYNDYQSGQAQGRTQVEIGLKKQLFNERLSVQLGGSLDVEGEKAKHNSASDITSDVTVEYKLTKDGRYRLKAFRHNLYEGAIEGQLVETGAGVLYVRDFNKWNQFFIRQKSKKALSKTEKVQ